MKSRRTAHSNNLPYAAPLQPQQQQQHPAGQAGLAAQLRHSGLPWVLPAAAPSAGKQHPAGGSSTQLAAEQHPAGRTCCSRSISMIRGTTRIRNVVPAIQPALPASSKAGGSGVTERRAAPRQPAAGGAAVDAGRPVQQHTAKRKRIGRPRRCNNMEAK